MLFAQQDPHFGSHAANILGDNCVYDASMKIQSFHISEKIVTLHVLMACSCKAMGQKLAWHTNFIRLLQVKNSRESRLPKTDANIQTDCDYIDNCLLPKFLQKLAGIEVLPIG